MGLVNPNSFMDNVPPLTPVLGSVRCGFLSALILAICGCASAPRTRPSPEYRLVGGFVVGASQLMPTAGQNQSRLELACPDPDLLQAFDWSKRQALAYARDAGDPVGPWIEGGEPGRESFCMRDISHQAIGAHALGLDRHMHNMMHRFAENISESRDWCSYWGMTLDNEPRRVDYRDDAHFWYCLPANFDDLDCCYRMYLWSGDESYVTDPVFLNFYDRTTHDYVDRWNLAIDQIMRRPRLMNVRGIFDPADKFQKNRGIPGYNEQDHEYTVGIDLLAKQYVAYRAYSYIQSLLGHQDQAKAFADRARALHDLVNTTFWNQQDQSFYLRLDKDHKPEGRSGAILLYHGMVEDSLKAKAALIDAGPDVLYPYGDPDIATTRMLETALTDKARRDYPETSYSWMGTFVNGTMGITLIPLDPKMAWTKGTWVQAILKTYSGLGTKIAWAELRHLPVRANEITVRHDGTTKTTVSNERGPAFIWQPTFAGDHQLLLVNGYPMPATVETDLLGRPMSSLRVTIGAGGAVTVEVPE
jgi:hypothetical protein